MNIRFADIRRRSAFTLVELVVSTGISVLVGGAIMLILLQVAKEHYRAVADQTVEAVSSDLENRLLQRLRSMSGSGGAIFSSPVASGSKTFRKVMVSRGPAPDYPREELSFDSANGRVMHVTNVAKAGTSIVLFTNKPGSYRLLDLHFFPGVKPDGSPDGSLINVSFTIDDHGSTKRLLTGSPVTLERTFSVRVRNN